MKNITLFILLLCANLTFAQEQPFANKVGALKYLVARPSVQDLNISGTVAKWHSTVRIGTTPLTNNITVVIPQNFLDEKGYIELKRIDGASYTVTVVAYVGDVVNLTNPTALNFQGGSLILRSVSATRSEQVAGLSTTYLSSISNDSNAQMFTDNTPTQITNSTNITESIQIRRSGVTVLGSTGVGITDSNAKLKVVGNIELDNSTSITGNFTKNGSLFLHNKGGYSLFLGEQSGNNNNSAFYNTGIGAYTLVNNSGGSDNTAIGSQSQRFSTGSANSSLGSSALLANTTGFTNIAIGATALWLNTIGNSNISIGNGSLANNTTASNNTGIGHSSLSYNKTGIYNVGIGEGSLYNNLASNNIGIGYYSLGYNTSINAGFFNIGTTYTISNSGTTDFTLIGSANNTAGTNFVASGAGSGTGTALAMNTGAYNVAIGNTSLSKNTTGTSNVGIGSYTLINNTTGSNNTGIGSNTLTNNTSGFGNLGIGGYALNYNNTGYYNVGIGEGSLYVNTTGRENVAIGQASLTSNTTGFANTAIGTYAYANNQIGNATTAIGYNTLLNTIGSYNTGLGSYAGSSNISETAGNFVIGAVYKINNTGTTNFTLIGSSSNSSGTLFTSTGVGIGTGTATRIASGTNNTSIGYRTSDKIGTGEYNVFLGSVSGSNSSQLHSVFNSIAIGANSYTTASNQVVIGDDNITETKLKGVVTLNNLITLKNYIVSALPVAPATYSIAAVSDALTPTSGAAVVGGGAVKKVVMYDGATWVVL